MQWIPTLDDVKKGDSISKKVAEPFTVSTIFISSRYVRCKGK